MTNVVQLNVAKHKDVRVITERSAEYGDNVMLCMTFPSEYRSIQAYYPILFRKDGDKNQFYALSLFGLEDGENLFLDAGGWQAGYIPLMMQRLPFLIGVQKTSPESGEEERRVVHIDMDHARVSNEKGELLFTQEGKNTSYLERSAAILETIHRWSLESDLFLKAIADKELLEQVSIDITLNDGKKGQLQGFYAISEERLSKLTASDLEELHKSNFLQPIYMAIASLSNIRKLSDLKSEKGEALPEYS